MSASVTISGNAEAEGGKWSNYYYDPIYLGALDNGGTDNHWADGYEYVQTTTGSGFPSIKAWVNNPLNAGYTYKLTFSHLGGTDVFTVKKCKGTIADNTLEETIYANSTSGNGRYWVFNGTSSNAFSIDLGIMINIDGIFANAEHGDIIEIEVPAKAADALDKRKQFNNVWSTYIRLPWQEKKAYNTDLIPFNIKNTSFTMVFATLVPKIMPAINNNNPKISGFKVYGVPSGVSGININFVWSIDTEAQITNVADSVYSAFDTDNPWMYGREFFDDTIYSGNILLNHSPAGDASAGASELASGIAGHARLRIATYDEPGTTQALAHNQWHQIFLIKS